MAMLEPKLYPGMKRTAVWISMPSAIVAWFMCVYKGRIVKTAGPELARNWKKKVTTGSRKRWEMRNVKAEQQYIDLFAQWRGISYVVIVRR